MNPTRITINNKAGIDAKQALAAAGYMLPLVCHDIDSLRPWVEMTDGDLVFTAERKGDAMRVTIKRKGEVTK